MCLKAQGTKRILLLIAGLLIIPILLVAQSDFSDFHVNRYTTEQGVSGNRITALLRDYKGFLWVGTDRGLSRFDGVQFRTFDLNDKPVLVLAIQEDHRKTLWVLTQEQLLWFDRMHERFVAVTLPDGPLLNNAIADYGGMTSDCHGNLWAGNARGLYRINVRTRKAARLPFKSQGVSSLFADKRGVVWIGTYEGNLHLFDPAKGLTRRYAFGHHRALHILRRIRENHDGNLLVSTLRGIFELNPQTGQSVNYYTRYGLKSSFRNNEIQDFLERGDQLWMATWGRGLHILDRRTNRSYFVETRPANNNSLSHNDVNCLLEDASGAVWIGTQEGLNLYNATQPLFTLYQHDPDNPRSLGFNMVVGFAEDADTTLWVGTYGGGLYRYDNRLESFRAYTSQPGRPGLLDNAVRAITPGLNNDLWIATRQGLDQFFPAQKRFVHYVHDPRRTGSLIDNDVMALCRDTDSLLWIGTYGKGVCYLDLKAAAVPAEKATFRTVVSPAQLGSNRVRVLKEPVPGYIYIGTLGGGLTVFSKATGRCMQYRHTAGKAGSLSNDYVNAVHGDNRGRIWVGTWNGLSYFDPATGIFHRVSLKEFFPIEHIADVLSDDKGTLWVTSPYGLCRLYLSPENKVVRVVRYGRHHGLQGDYFTVGGAFKSMRGTLFFGGSNGFNRFVPNVKTGTRPARAVLTDFEIFNKRVPIGRLPAGRVVLPVSVSETDSILLNYDDKVISFRFAALGNPGAVPGQIAYQMEGIDREFVSTNADRFFASYSNLSPGTYSFRLKSSDEQGNWQVGQAVSIVVSPPFWRTNAAYTLEAILLLGFALLVRRYYRYRQAMRTALLRERLERQKEQELTDLKISFYTQISHELRTPLTLIIGPLEKLVKQIEKPQQKRQLSVAYRNANRLLQLINQLLDFRKAEAGRLRLQASSVDMMEVLREIKQNFDDVAEDRQIRYMLTGPPKGPQVWLDTEKFEKIAYNLLANAFKYTPPGGEITIHVEPHKTALTGTLPGSGPVLRDYVEIAFCDTGAGIPPEQLPFLFSPFFQTSNVPAYATNPGTGLGLALTRELVELHKGTIRAENQPSGGLCFTVLLPLGDDHLSAAEKIASPNRPDQTRKVTVDATPEPTTHEAPPVTSQEVAQFADLLTHSEKLQVLVVDDNPEIRLFIRESLSDTYKIFEAADGTEGLQIALETVPDLIISDLVMPKMDGLVLCRHLKSDLRTSHIPVILLTARTSVDHQIQGFETGADDYVSKPFHLELLKIRVRSLIENRVRLREKFAAAQGQPDVLTTTGLSALDQAFMKSIIEHIEANLSNPEFSIDALTDRANMSRTQFYRKLKAITSQSPNVLIRNYRLHKARQLLLTTTMNVSEVATEVGFNDPLYFSRCFRKEFGVAPNSLTRKKI